MYDVIIIGMGISGISAGLYAKGANLNVLMFESYMPGGLLNKIDKISNYAGKSNVSGPDFALDLFNQVNDAGIPYKNESIIKIDLDNDIKKVYTNNEVYEAKNIIIATGRRPKLLGLDNEESLIGKGLSTCAVCDALFYKGKDVVVVGGGNSAMQEAIYLSKIVKSITMLVRGNKFIGQDHLIEEINNAKNIKVLFNSRVKQINEKDNKIESVTLFSDEVIKTEGVFLYLGFKPSNDLVKDFDILTPDGYIDVDSNYETKIKGVYAIGDIIKKEIYQLVTAAAEGAVVISKIAK